MAKYKMALYKMDYYKLANYKMPLLNGSLSIIRT